MQQFYTYRYELENNNEDSFSFNTLEDVKEYVLYLWKEMIDEKYSERQLTSGDLIDEVYDDIHIYKEIEKLNTENNYRLSLIYLKGCCTELNFTLRIFDNFHGKYI